MRPHQQENLRNASQTLGNVTLGSGGCRWWFHHSYINRNVVLLVNRGLRKSGGKGKKYDKEAVRASLDSRYFRHLRHRVTVLRYSGTRLLISPWMQGNDPDFKKHGGY